jgi:hypothetical protein
VIPALTSAADSSSGTLLNVYYVTGVLAAVLATIFTARQLLKKLRERWVTEERREQTLESNTQAVQAFGSQLTALVDKIADHDHRIYWLEQQQSPDPPPRRKT